MWFLTCKQRIKLHSVKNLISLTNYKYTCTGWQKDVQNGGYFCQWTENESKLQFKGYNADIYSL